MYSVKMIDMSKEDDSDDAIPISKIYDRYPPGLTISLGNDELEKLDLEKNPEIGDMIHLFAMARVCSVSSHESSDGSPCCHVSLQITHLGMEDEDQEEVEEAA